MSVSLIIPSFNNSRYITDCVRSCLVQSYRDIEVVVVDDASTDSSWDLLLSMAKEDGRIQVHRLQENRGSNYCRNYGIDHSAGRHLLFLDSDDYLYSDRSVQALLSGFDGLIGVVHGDRCNDDGRSGVKKIVRQGSGDSRDMLIRYLKKPPITSTLMFDRRVFATYRWDEKLLVNQEYSLLIDMLIGGVAIAHVPEVISVIRLHDSPIRKSNLNRDLYLCSRAELHQRFERLLRAMNGLTAERADYFNLEFAKMSYLLRRFSNRPADLEVARQLWKKVDRIKLLWSREIWGEYWLAAAACIGPAAAASLIRTLSIRKIRYEN
jgi:glycosyltransferase involved in cell wall biosynthesis